MLYVLACLYVSMYYIRPTEWVPGIIDMPIFSTLGIISLAILAFGALSGEIKLLKGVEEKMMAGFITAIALSYASKLYLQGVIDAISRTLPVIVGYFLMSSSIINRNRYNNFVLLLIALTTFLAYEGWLQYSTGFAHGGAPPLIIRYETPDGDIAEMVRLCWYGVFGDPNDLGLVLVIVVPFLLNMLLMKQFVLPAICLPLIMFSIYQTNSRGTYLAFLAAISAFFVIRYRNRAGAITGLVLAGILFTFGPTRMSGLSSSEESAQGRLEAWHAGFQMFKSSPLFGVGQDMFLEYNDLTSHNSFVHVMAELGLFGLFFFVAMIYFPFSWLWRNLFQNQSFMLSEEDMGRVSSVFSSLVGLLSAMFFLSRTYVLIPYILFVLTTACVRLCVPVSGFAAAPLPAKLHFKYIVLATVTLIAFIKLMTMAFIL